jgi:hypothetical protein
MATIRIHNVSNINAEGTRTNGNCKAVFCITTGEVYASARDAAEIIGCNPSNVSWAATGRMNTCKGLRICYIADIIEHLDEIASIARERNNKVVEYNKIIAKEEAARKARENLVKRQAKCEMLRQQLEKEMTLLAEASKEVDALNA